MTSPTPLFDISANLAVYTPTLSSYQQENFTLGKDFLLCYKNSPATYKTYRKDIERFVQWASHIQKKAIQHLDRQDIEKYIEFCQSPPPSWIGNNHVPRFVDVAGERQANKSWRPFVVRQSKSEKMANPTHKNNFLLSASALKDALSILSSFYNYHTESGRLNRNPIRLLRQKSRLIAQHNTQRSIRRLSELQWSTLLETTEKMTIDNPERYERSLFILSCLYAMYLRISELTASQQWIPLMSHFHQDYDGQWWFRTLGKGNKQRDIAVSDAMLKALSRYRHFLGHSSLPAVDDHRPLIPKLRGHGAIGNTATIRKLVQECYDRTVDVLYSNGFTHEAQQMKAATVHWLRHTGISEDVKIRPREHVRDDAGHSSSAITDRYIDIEKRERHQSAKKKKLDPDAIT